jgi:hypothetical protein
LSIAAAARGSSAYTKAYLSWSSRIWMRLSCSNMIAPSASPRCTARTARKHRTGDRNQGPVSCNTVVVSSSRRSACAVSPAARTAPLPIRSRRFQRATRCQCPIGFNAASEPIAGRGDISLCMLVRGRRTLTPFRAFGTREGWALKAAHVPRTVELPESVIHPPLAVNPSPRLPRAVRLDVPADALPTPCRSLQWPR